MPSSPFPITIILDNIRSALNVGAIFRTADGAGIKQLILSGITPYPPHNKIPKTALGAIEMISWKHSKNTMQTMSELKKDKNQIISVEQTNDSKLYTSINFLKPTTLIFGNEISGVSEDILNKSDATIYIPMHGDKKSLNVATTVGIVVYEVIRQWTRGNSK